MAVSVPFTGGCACGAIRYECTAEPFLVWKCHCRDCQQLTGGAFFVGVFVPSAAFTFTTGEPTYYVRQGGTGKTTRMRFCPPCGSTVGGRVDEYPDIRCVGGASLDDPSGLEPAADTWTASAQPWDYMNPGLPKYEHMPTDEQIQELIAAKS